MQVEERMVGVPVFTADGSQIGKLKEIYGRFFKVDAPLQPDYWLSEDQVASSTGSEIRLSFAEDRLGDYKLGDPEDYEAEGTDRDSVDVTASGSGYRGGGPGDFDPRSNQGAGRQEVIGWADVAGEHRTAWQSHYGTGARWEDFEPAYRYGHEMSYEPRYEGREWSEIEPELGRNYGQWSQQHGYHYDENEWERIREHSREAMNRGRIQRAA